MNSQLRDRLMAAFNITIALFGLFMIYQLVIKIFGGSWVTESLIIALLVLNVTMTFSLAVNLTRTKADLSHLSNQFKSLAHDFKEHRKEFVELKTELKTDVGNLKKDVNTLNNKLDTLTKKFDDYLSKRTLKSS